MKKKQSTYAPMPVVPAEMQQRYRVVLSVMAGALTVSEGARQLGLSRNQFQTILHKGLGGLLEGLSPKAPGRPGRPPEEKKLLEQANQLHRENRQLHQQVQMLEKAIEAVSDLVKGRGMVGRAPRSRPAKPTTPAANDDDDARSKLTRVRELRSMGVKASVAARLVGQGAATVRRWRAHERRGEILVGERGHGRAAALDEHTAAIIEDRVRSTRGLSGAESLRHTVPGVSRRQCAAVKKDTTRTMERERIASSTRVEVTTPGVMRGFDQMYVPTTVGQRLLLLSADAAIPFRTSVTTVERYDGRAVAGAIERDIDRNGAPLVYRLDRARSHDTPIVRNVLAANDVLVLHGPPRCPRYYGQLERQNREHRAWLATLGLLDPEVLDRESERMLAALNCEWKRPTLRWRTAHDLWSTRQAVNIDRDELREEVQARAARIRRQMNQGGRPADFAERLAIEAALTQRGLLRRTAGGWC
jgi:transposase